MKKITTMILTGIFCLALFIPSGCKETGNEIDCEATLLQYRLKDNFFEENPVYGVAYTNERYNPDEDNGERPYLYDETSPANRTFIITEKKQAETIFEDTFVDYDKTDFQKEFFIRQLDLAKELNFDYIISMAHPDNIASCKTLEKIGLDFVKETTLSNGFLRKLYMKKLN